MRNSESAITVVVPCKDPHPGFFREATASVFAQTDPRWRLLVVIEPDRDAETRALLEELAGRRDERVAMLENESRWLTGAFNTAMRRASTAWMCPLHCDDRLAPETLEVLHAAVARHPNADFVHSARRIIDARGRALSGILPPRESFALTDFRRHLPVHRLHCWRVEAALAIGGMDESLGPHGADDYDFLWCLAEAGCRFRAVPECLYLVRDHRESFRLTTHVPLDVQVAELQKILCKHGLTEAESEAEIARRSSGYLRQALFLNEGDRHRKLANGFDARSGWRLSYPSS